jgi:DNA-binding NarL/FixJ family response regulator
VVVTFDVAIEHLKPFDLRTWSARQVPLFVLLPPVSVEDDHYEHLLRCGVSGFLSSDTTLDGFSRAVKSVMDGELWLSRKFQSNLIRKSLFQLDRQFTPREREILERIAAGDTNCDIAERLFITRETVRWHLRCVYAKLGVHSRKALTELLRSAGGVYHDSYDPEAVQRVAPR